MTQDDQQPHDPLESCIICRKPIEIRTGAGCDEHRDAAKNLVTSTGSGIPGDQHKQKFEDG